MTTNKNKEYDSIHSNLPIPPGEYLEEVIEELGMNKDDLARRLERPASKLSAIFKGEKAITPDTALRLEKVVGIPAHIWTGLETEYRLTLARLEEKQHEERLQTETKMVSKFCYNELVKIGEVKKYSKPIDKARELHRFFGTVSLTTVPTLRRYQPAFRKGNAGGESPEALAAWIRVGERRAAQAECKPFSKDKLKNTLDSIRQFTNDPPDQFMPALTESLASCGVALIVCPHFPKTKAHGATFQLKEDKTVLMITIRYRWADIFWFSLFHEIGHILNHSLKNVILENDEHNQREVEADAFACDALISPRDYRLFIKKNAFDLKSVLEFSKGVNIHPGIVVGRLQHEKKIKRNWHNELREQYAWKQ